ncbi:Carboxylic ester hydrolase [Colletotrichum asianum]
MDTERPNNARPRRLDGTPPPTYEMTALGQQADQTPSRDSLLLHAPDSNSQRQNQQEDDSLSDGHEQYASRQNTVSSQDEERTMIQSTKNEEESGHRRNNQIGAWWQEILCCAISIVSLVVLIVFLHIFNGKPLPAWPSGITVNAVVAFLSTIARTAFLIPVVEGLSQCKWNWFKQKSRPLKDFDLFDQASRGPWGGLILLGRTKGWLLGVLSAILLITGIATSTVTQSAVTYPSRPVEVPGGKADAWRSESYFWTGASALHTMQVMAPKARGIAQGLFTTPTEVLPYKEPQCSTSHCTWRRFSTIAVCYNVTDVTDLIKTNSTEIKYRTKIALPNGINMTVQSAFSNALTSSGSSLSYNGTPFMDAALYDYFGIYLDMPWSGPFRLKAVEVLFHWCINTYEPEIKDNTLNMKLALSHTEMHRGDAVAPTWSNDAVKNITYLTSPADEGGKYVFGGSGVNSIWELLNNSLSGFSINNGDNQFNTGSDMLIHADAVKKNESTEAWLEVIDGMARNIAAGLTNSLFAAEANVKGIALQNEVYVQVRWPWLVLLAAQVLIAIVCLLLVMRETAKTDMDVVKSSTIAALFAISAEEKAGLKHRLDEHGEHLIGREDDSRLAPLSIRGELRKRDGEWTVGSP